ncbi:unnamed protein product [Caenorhabditis bovis]|uniref:Uncharacterized protein n=1 Tax=Caenorhabditis bovis TaxID=2654633 RepID=A0A8S1E9F8_9PELO|nr:unnamed protein product [Caenorhabditis bovis]
MRAARSNWSVSPETIISHHYRLTKGIPAVVDATAPYSMYNSPISIHYLPKRASSADPLKRKPLSKSQRELNDFVNGRNSSTNLRLPLPIRSSLTELAKPKLLENRNYQPPRRRNVSFWHKPAQSSQVFRQNPSAQLSITKFKDDVLTEIIKANVYTDKFILSVLRRHREQLAGIIPWNDLEKASQELLEHLDVKPEIRPRSHTLKIEEELRNSVESLSISSSSSSSKSSSSSSSRFSSSSDSSN